MNIKKYIFLGVVAVMLSLQSCQQAGVNNTGSEYMPDMGHSVAYEANYYNYYYYNTWGSEEEYYQFAQPKLPVNGTVPRRGNGNGFNLPTQGSVPYYYRDTEEERTRAITEIIDNPLPITEAGLDEGKELYVVFCATCHGEKADGNGYLVRDGGAYPAQPANFLLEEHLKASNGRYYHAIMHGKNVMGGYSDKISYEERWNVIHYIRSLQAKELKLTYSQLENTLNTVDKPAGANYMAVSIESHDVEMEHEDNHHHLDGDHHEGHDDSHVDHEEEQDGHEGDHDHGDEGHH
ncbi:MAG: mono/diheme cytochrome c family protein [Saprospiraceae bacterium]|jgi:mono/diheme cytochrome c family protein